MTRLQALARAVLAHDEETRDSILAYMWGPSTLAAPCVMDDESDVARGVLVLAYVDPFNRGKRAIRATIRATFDGRPFVRVTGHNRHGARDKLESMLPQTLSHPFKPGESGGATHHQDAPPDLPPDLA